MNTQFSQQANHILEYSRQEACRLKSKVILPEHILLGIIRDGNSAAMDVLNQMGVPALEVKRELESFLKKFQNPDQEADADIKLSVDSDRILKICNLEARKMKSQDVNAEHILLSVLRDEDSMASTILSHYNVSYDSAFRQLTAVPSTPASQPDVAERSQQPAATLDDEEDDDTMFSKKFDSTSRPTQTASRPAPKEANRKSDTPVLDNFSVDLTQRAKEGRLDPVIGRENEIMRVAQILNRKKKNNPVLIGEPGVGKSAIVEGLAQRIQKGDVPRLLIGKRVLMLDLTAVVSGTKYRGQFEERMRSIIKELQDHKDIILFIDELHIIMGAGSAQGSMDAANILKPALARGEIQCIGATTSDEYKKTIEKDGALERRFQKVYVEPTSYDETLQILFQIRESYENHHHVRYTDQALENCVRLTQRYITDRQFPDKAIDALDEAGARTKIADREDPGEIKAQEQLLEEVRMKKSKAADSQNFELAAGFRDKEAEILQNIESLKNRQLELLDKDRPVIDAEEIAQVVSMISGVPVSRMAKSEGIVLTGMRSELERVVIGQNTAIEKITKAIIRSRVGLKEPGKPIGTFLFLGPTGVGKTFLTKQLANIMFGSPDALIRLDMSEYAEEYNVTKLIGTSPGYVGYEEGGHLTERVRRKPYSIILLDEIEKAHPRIYNLLLQLLDEGRLTDSFGRTVDFRNTVIIMTSNVGSRQLKEFSQGVGFHAPSRNDQTYADGVIRKALNQQFSPEFLNRIDDIITFSSLSREHIRSIVDLELDKLLGRIAQIGFTLELSDAARDFLSDKGYDEQYGARPLHRALQEFVEDPLSEMMLEKGIESGGHLTADVSEDGKTLVFS